MTKKDYEVIATGLLMATGDTNHTIVVANFIADELEKDNPRFDRTKFLTACGMVAWQCRHKEADLVPYNSDWAECLGCGRQINRKTKEVWNDFEKPTIVRAVRGKQE